MMHHMVESSFQQRHPHQSTSPLNTRSVWHGGLQRNSPSPCGRCGSVWSVKTCNDAILFGMAVSHHHPSSSNFVSRDGRVHASVSMLLLLTILQSSSPPTTPSPYPTSSSIIVVIGY
mmetsp:Transcript_16911/g.36493  ORF Transcript_16911/g.36493 Transcript_16911/m.36493 type:complete len:117 (+) Transcript_16911:71-421(+)